MEASSSSSPSGRKRQPREVDDDAVRGEGSRKAVHDGSSGEKRRLGDGAEQPSVNGDDNGMGDFEDAFEDDEAEDEDVIDGGDLDDAEGDDDGMEVDEEEAGGAGAGSRMEVQQNADDDEEAEDDVKVYLPGDKLEEGQVLEHDASAYDMLHALNVEWPCLSFDILRDNLGAERTSFPMTMYVVAGSQADTAANNKITVMKMSQLCKTKHDDDIEDDDSDDEGTDDDPIVDSRSVKHVGGVNRVRVMPHPELHVVASWSESARVHIWDLTEHVRSLDAVGGSLTRNLVNTPVHTFSGHPTEGFALDWSPTVSGRLLSGDCKRNIFLTQTADGSKWTTDDKPFTGHEDSVEDLQWSPCEQNVFASSSVDRTVRIWDLRSKKNAALTVQAHTSDVNVIAWNRSVQYLLASGSDDGVFSVWDLRNFKSNTPAATFKWHKAPITSLEWHPKEESVLAVSGADDQVSIWDFSLEADEETMAQGVDVPPQLLFIHQGQQDIKEVHWHAQIPGVLVSTAATGFNIFKTISV